MFKQVRFLPPRPYNMRKLAIVLFLAALTSCGALEFVTNGFKCDRTNTFYIYGVSWVPESGNAGYCSWHCDDSPTEIWCYEYSWYTVVIHELIHAITQIGNEGHADNPRCFFATPSGYGYGGWPCPYEWELLQPYLGKVFYVLVFIDDPEEFDWIDRHVMWAISLMNEWVGYEMLVVTYAGLV